LVLLVSESATSTAKTEWTHLLCMTFLPQVFENVFRVRMDYVQQHFRPLLRMRRGC
uniref:PDEase domain-containing protein n=1 Tax=Haemonchus placei TaxID=6290 RepID=A0A0N4WWT3_HAEPC